MAWHLALMAAPAIMSLGTTVFSWIKGSQQKKKAKAQMAQIHAQQKQQIARMMAQYQGMNMGAVGGMNANYLAPSGLGANAYGPAPAGYYPRGFG